MDDQQTDQHAFTDATTEDLTEYRPLSTLAVLGLVAGMAAPLAFASGWFLFAPVLGALFSIAAIRGIRSNREASSGVSLAAIGLTLSLLVFGAVLTRDAIATRMLEDSARQTAERFVQLLGEGDRVGAHELTFEFADRQPTPEAAAQLIEQKTSSREALDKFAGERGVRLVLAAPSKAEYVDVIGVVRQRGGRHSAAFQYRVPTESGERPLYVAVRLQRSEVGPSRSAWKVTSCDVLRPRR